MPYKKDIIKNIIILFFKNIDSNFPVKNAKKMGRKKPTSDKYTLGNKPIASTSIRRPILLISTSKIIIKLATQTKIHMLFLEGFIYFQSVR